MAARGPRPQRRPAPGPGRDRRHALQGGSAELRRLRREAGVRARPDARAGQLPPRPPGRAHLRGHLEGRRDRLPGGERRRDRSEEHTSELQSLMRISYAVFYVHKKTKHLVKTHTPTIGISIILPYTMIHS